jgi:hypothetical protein
MWREGTFRLAADRFRRARLRRHQRRKRLNHGVDNLAQTLIFTVILGLRAKVKAIRIQIILFFVLLNCHNFVG